MSSKDDGKHAVLALLAIVFVYVFAMTNGNVAAAVTGIVFALVGARLNANKG